MTKTKAQKHLKCAIESRNFWREAYVENERNTNKLLDVKMMLIGMTLREEKRIECIQEIKEANERIAKFQRIVL